MLNAPGPHLWCRSQELASCQTSICFLPSHEAGMSDTCWYWRILIKPYQNHFLYTIACNCEYWYSRFLARLLCWSSSRLSCTVCFRWSASACCSFAKVTASGVLGILFGAYELLLLCTLPCDALVMPSCSIPLYTHILQSLAQQHAFQGWWRTLTYMPWLSYSVCTDLLFVPSLDDLDCKHKHMVRRKDVGQSPTEWRNGLQRPSCYPSVFCISSRQLFIHVTWQTLCVQTLKNVTRVWAVLVTL